MMRKGGKRQEATRSRTEEQGYVVRTRKVGKASARKEKHFVIWEKNYFRSLFFNLMS